MSSYCISDSFHETHDLRIGGGKGIDFLTARSRTKHCMILRETKKRPEQPFVFTVMNANTSLHDHTSNPVHGPLDIPPHGIPIRPALCKLIHLFGAENAVVAIIVGDDGGQFLAAGRARRRVLAVAIDEVDLREFAQGGKIREQGFLAQVCDEGAVEVYIAVSIGGVC